MPLPDFISKITIGLYSFSILIILNYIDIQLIKLNFLLFFHYLRNYIKIYYILQQFIIVFNLAASTTIISLIDFKYLMLLAEQVITIYNSPSLVIESYTASKISCLFNAIRNTISKFPRADTTLKTLLTKYIK